MTGHLFVVIFSVLFAVASTKVNQFFTIDFEVTSLDFKSSLNGSETSPNLNICFSDRRPTTPVDHFPSSANVTSTNVTSANTTSSRASFTSSKKWRKILTGSRSSTTRQHPSTLSSTSGSTMPIFSSFVNGIFWIWSLVYPGQSDAMSEGTRSMSNMSCTFGSVAVTNVSSGHVSTTRSRLRPYINDQKIFAVVDIFDPEATFLGRFIDEKVISDVIQSDNGTWTANLTNSNNSWGNITYRWRMLIEDAPKAENLTCLPGCHPNHGYCEKNNECKCKFGWMGPTCHSCLPMPGCVHGSCLKPFECRCEDGWTGVFCDKPTCQLGCHPSNGFCTLPNECRCRFGFKGQNCSDCDVMPGCHKGYCHQPLDCLCHEGWKGLFCNIPTCSDGCHPEHGWCKRPKECRCRVGWTGPNCTECVAYPGCVHGKCLQESDMMEPEPWTCKCDSGWGGLTCEEKVNYCEVKGSPCQNGGSCVSIEERDGGFTCLCPSGYRGQTCQEIG